MHGYDHPWPGGGGKNKAEGFGAETKNGITCTINSAGEIVFSGTTTSQVAFNGRTFTTEAGNYYLNGCPDGGNMETTYDLYIWDMTSNRRPYKWIGTRPSDSVINSAENAEVKIESGHEYRLVIRFRNGYVANNVVFKPMLRLASETDATFAPYSNICPISGWTGAEIYHEAEYDADASPKISVNWEDEAGTVYGGKATLNPDGSADVVSTMGNIASYDGETLSGTWISSMDVYTEGSTPTTGAQVVYELAEPQTYQLTAEQVSGILTALEGINVIWANTGDVTVTYIAKSAKFSFDSPLHIYNYNNLKLFGNTYIEHGKG